MQNKATSLPNWTQGALYWFIHSITSKLSPIQLPTHPKSDSLEVSLSGLHFTPAKKKPS